MKQLPIILFALIMSLKSFSQNTTNEYSKLIKEGWKLCLDKDYKNSAKLYKKSI